MTTNFIGDMSQNFGMRKHQSILLSEVQRLSLEATTGRHTNVSERVRGDFQPLAALEVGISETDSHLTTIQESGHFAETMQLSLSRVEEETLRIAPRLALLASGGNENSFSTVGEESKSALLDVASTLNTRLSGRAVFSGTATDTTAIGGIATLFSDLQGVIASETTAAGVVSAVDSWFGTGGGFETNHYTGSANALSPIKLSDRSSVTLSVKANDEEILATLSSLALGAALLDGPLSGDVSESQELAKIASERVFTASNEITNLRGVVGSKEERIETVQTQLEAEKVSLDLMRNSILEADPYEAASRLQEVQTQLEILYSITARTSRLSLADFLQ